MTTDANNPSEGDLAEPPPSKALYLFGAAFLIPGLLVLILGPLDTLYLHWQSASWDKHPVVLESVDLQVSRNDGTTYRVVADYHYEYNGQHYRGDRVSYDQSSDNIGDYHQRTHRSLERTLSRGGRVMAWVNPDDPSQSLLRRDLRPKKMLFSGLFGLIFAFVGGGMIAINRRKSPLQKDQQGEVSIRSGQQSAYRMLLFIGVVCLALSLPGTLAIPEEIGKGNWAILLVLIFVAVGLWMLFLAWKAWRNWRFYGPMPLYPDPCPGQLGGHVAGHIRFARDWPASVPVTIQLQCVRRWVSGSGKNRSTRENVLWSEEMVAQRQSQGQETRFQFQFSPPKTLPATEPKSDDYRLWRVHLETEGLQGIALDRTYEIPVQYGEQLTAQPLPDTFLAQQQRQRDVQTLTDVAEQIEWHQTGDHLQLISRAGRQWGFHLTLLAVGLIMSGAAAFLFDEAAREGAMLYFMAAVFSLFGVPMTIGGWFCIFRGQTADIRGHDVVVQRQWMGFTLWQRKGVLQDAAQLKISSAGSYNAGTRSVEFFHLECTHQGKSLRLAEGIRGREQAEALRDGVARVIGLDENKP